MFKQIAMFFLLFCALDQLVYATTNDKNNRIQISLNVSEAEQVLAILELRQKGAAIDSSVWQKLSLTKPYIRLKKREAVIAKQFNNPKGSFTDEDFKKFILSDDILKQFTDLKTILERWKAIDLQSSAERILTYLPSTAKIYAEVYPVIKPKDNSFVWEPSTDPAIFLYLDPSITSKEFENTVAHEFHHIGLASVQSDFDQQISVLTKPAQSIAIWMEAFGEGQAMLAAAGSPDADPKATSKSEDRERWNSEMKNFDNNLKEVNTFFLDVLSGKIVDEDSINAKGSSFFGIQGPWYTVGYKMSILVERRFGRIALIETMLDPRKLLVLYNQAAEELNKKEHSQLPLWSDEILKKVCVE